LENSKNYLTYSDSIFIYIYYNSLALENNSNTTFLYPVLFSIDDLKILVVSYPYFQKIEGDEIIGSFTKNEGLYWVRDTGSSPEKILDTSMFDSEWKQ